MKVAIIQKNNKNVAKSYVGNEMDCFIQKLVAYLLSDENTQEDTRKI